MAVRVLAFLALLSVKAISFEVLVESSLHFDTNDAKNRPVTKVITLLKDMQKQLEKEAEEDEEIYEKMACWCETNDKEKTKAIADAEARIQDLTTSIEEMTAASARLNTEIKNLEKEVAENQAALEKATAIRTKELAEFNAEEKDMLQSISALKSAIVVLSKHHPSSALLQSVQMQVATTLQYELRKHSALLAGVLTRSQKQLITSFVQAPEDYFDAEPTFKQSYAPASGQIFGILKQMKETFESNLSQSQKDELANQKGYEDLKAAKEEEIAASQAQIDTKTQELATTDEKLAQSKQDIEDTRNSLSADEKFLMNLKETCQMTDQEWEERQKSRQEEIEAVSKALAVLSSDDAHDLFSKTFNPALLEKENSQHLKRREAASKLLSEAAKKFKSPRLTALATKVRLDAFTRVKKAIDDMVTQLQKEGADEIKHKDYCVSGFNENDRITETKQRDKSDLMEKIEDLTMTIDEFAKAIEAAKAEIAEMQVQMKRAGEDREKENKEFQLTVADQRATQKLLAQALNVLKGFYDKKAKAALVQQSQEPAGPPPPPGFKSYKKNAAAGGVMGMLQQIINDAKAMEAEALKAEEDAQKAYEDFVKETNDSIAEKSKEIINKSEEKAKAEGDKTEAEEAKENVMLELDQLSNEAADLHKACDFVIKNFDIRQTARAEEIEALKQAKAILSGAKFDAFLQS
jgi:hypothetical protein